MQVENSFGVEAQVRVLSWLMNGRKVLEPCETAVSEDFVFIESKTGRRKSKQVTQMEIAFVI